MLFTGIHISSSESRCRRSFQTVLMLFKLKLLDGTKASVCKSLRRAGAGVLSSFCQDTARPGAGHQQAGEETCAPMTGRVPMKWSRSIRVFHFLVQICSLGTVTTACSHSFYVNLQHTPVPVKLLFDTCAGETTRLRQMQRGRRG